MQVNTKSIKNCINKKLTNTETNTNNSWNHTKLATIPHYIEKGLLAVDTLTWKVSKYTMTIFVLVLLSFTTLKFAFDCTIGPGILLTLCKYLLLATETPLINQLPGQKEMVISSTPGFSNETLKRSYQINYLGSNIAFFRYSLWKVGPWEIYFYSMHNYFYRMYK